MLRANGPNLSIDQGPTEHPEVPRLWLAARGSEGPAAQAMESELHLSPLRS